MSAAMSMWIGSIRFSKENNLYNLSKALNWKHLRAREGMSLRGPAPNPAATALLSRNPTLHGLR